MRLLPTRGEPDGIRPGFAPLVVPHQHARIGLRPVAEVELGFGDPLLPHHLVLGWTTKQEDAVGRRAAEREAAARYKVERVYLGTVTGVVRAGLQRGDQRIRLQRFAPD